jgi:4-diphosphocytidyl-2-C-methyl-D-erythritol kinase
MSDGETGCFERSTPNSGNDDAELAPAKVNLFLHVTGRRADGYHLLDSLAVFAGVADRIGFDMAEDLTLRLTGPFASSLAVEQNNLVLRAARALAIAMEIEPTGALTLEKRIPVASGIGGGSADAAAALRLLCRAWQINPPSPVLERIASDLGADVPVCLHNRPLRMGGIGDHLTSAPLLPLCGLLLVNPGVPLSTLSVFTARSGGYSAPAQLPGGWANAQDMAACLGDLRNDLQAAAICVVPAIADVLRAIEATRGCLLSRMSGSGATCFGLYADPAEAEAAAKAMRPGWWCWGGSLFA